MGQPRSGAAVRAVHGQRARRSATPARAQGPVAAGRAARCTGSTATPAPGAQQQHPRALRSRQRLLRRLARSDDELFERAVRCGGDGRSRSGAATARWAADRRAARRAAQTRARDRLRLGRARAAISPRAGAQVDRDQPVRRAARLGAAAPSAAGIDFRKQDYRDIDGPVRRRSSASRWSRRSAANTGRTSSIASPAASSPAGGRRSSSSRCATSCSRPMPRSADFIQTYVFPGGLLIRESEFRRLAAERGLAWERPGRLRPRLCRDAADLARELRPRGRRRGACPPASTSASCGCGAFT